jgi:hypothetical protein
MSIEKILKNNGFELKERDYYSKTTKGSDRFTHDFRFYLDDKTFYVDRNLMRGSETIPEKILIGNHNNLNSHAKEFWLRLKSELDAADIEYHVYGEEQP